MAQPRTFESYRLLADDILTGKFCDKNVQECYKKDILARILIDIYWEGWDDRTIDLLKQNNP